MRIVGRLGVALLALFTVPGVDAYPRMTFSQEPNDTPAQAQSVRGEARLVGEVAGTDRDLFWWALDDGETDRLWHVELQGNTTAGIETRFTWPAEEAPAQPSGISQFGAAQTEEAVVEETTLLALEVNADQPRRQHRQLIVPPGEHLISFLPEGAGGEYQLTLSEAGRLRISGRAGPDEADDLEVTPGRHWFFQLDVAEHVIPLVVEEDEAEFLWRLQLLGELGTPLEAWIENDAGERLAEVQADSPVQHQWGRLELAAGGRLYLRHPQGEAIGRVGLELEEDGQRPEPVAEAPEAAEVEAVATSEEEALWLAPGETLTLDLVPSGRRHQYLAFSLEGQAAGQRLDVVGDTDRDIEVCLDRRDGSDPVCRDGPGEGLFDAMRLPAGDYLLRLQLSRRAEAPVSTEVRLVEAALPDRAGWVAVPNDHRDWAAVLSPGEPRLGRFQAGQVGWFELNVSGNPQTWEIRAEGQPIDRLALYVAGERRPFLDSERSRRGDPLDERSLSPVWLLPGRYLVRVEGQDSDYRLEALPLGQPGPGREVEPNDRPEDANPLWLGEAIEGQFHGEDDVDHFHFHLPGENLVAIDVTPPEGLELRAELRWQGNRRLRVPVAEPTTLVERLPPGDYTLAVSGSEASPASYRVGVTIVEPALDSFPLMPEDGVIDKHLGDGGLWRLPVTEAARELQIEGRIGELGGGRTGLAFRTRDGEPLEIRDGEGRHQSVVTLPAGTEVLLETSFGRAARAVTLIDPAYPLSGEPESPAVAASLASEAVALAPFADVGQRVPVRLSLDNTEADTLSLPLEAHLSHAGSTLSGLPEAVELAPGESRDLALTLELPPALMERPPVSLFVRAGEASSARLDLPLAIGSEPVDPFPVPAVPAPLDGRVDLAWSALGAHFVDETEGADMRHGDFLIDGMASAASSIEVSGDPGEALVPIRLAGEGGRVHGLAFNQRSRHEHDYRWREVEISLGETLDALAPVITVELDSRDGEQFIPLEAPVEARYVQLRPLSLHLDEHERRRSRHGSGELRVLGEPRGELAERRHDLLDRELGGHWIYTLPESDRLLGLQGQRYTHSGITGERRARRGQRIRGERIEMVFAFLQHRAARLDALHWVDNLDWDGLPVEEVAVHTSLESPVGPWEHQADWALDRDEAGRAILALPEAPRARYLRLVFDEPAVPEGERRASWRIPEALQAFEADTLGSGRSILGHWGLDTPRGPLEAQQGAPFRSRGVEDPDSQADSPWPLGDSVVGRVAEPGDSRHYTLSLSAPDNTLAFEFEEPSRDRLSVSLHGPQGEPVPLEWSWRAGGRRQAEAVDIPPGEYRLTVTEPPRSIVFLWDGSGSVSSHQPAIYQALNRFAEGLEPGKEVFNMLPLGGPLLIDGWAEQPLQVAQTLAAYDGRFSSSDSEPSLALASRALEQRDGQRAIFLITDAEQTGREIEAWETLARVRPRIFTLEATHGSRKATEENRWYQNQMLSWAQVADGRYRYTVDRTSLIRGFEAGMRELRRPSEFLLAVERRYQEPPEPGSLAVVDADPVQPAVAAGVVHLIFDASGSMLRRMDGGRRIEVARTIVQQVLDERVPERVPVALRAYGHTEPHSCETELLVAPEAGSHAEVREAVSGIQAINLARTPLAASLAAVLDDLADYADQTRLVVMLTDGEETCDGDVAAAVDELIEEGVDVRLNIVGFHIDEIGLQAQFERFAARGGGEYFDSHDGDELIEGLANALAATWRVLDGTGEEVARGRVGDAAVELEVGEYELVVETQAGEQRQAFRVGPRQSVEIAIGAERG
ncbi:VWA domain-containing protein [Halomonas sp. C05BenzN]|uniref:VWA domain-containing protein n=1 Tax=Halomonas sp. C05BenzN TaxID=3411041 RepID=UPI003B93B987